MFKVKSNFEPTGDQPKAIEALTKSILKNNANQTLLGVTGSGKTFTVAKVIENIQRPTLIISHNKTLAAQLYQEFKEFFPNNAVEYFVSYYDYFQPESYIPQTDTYIEKDSDINEEIDKLRLSTTNSLITRKDVIVVASVSCIYNLGSPAEYSSTSIELKIGMKTRLPDLLKRLSDLYYERSDFEFKRGTFRVRGENIDIYPSYQDFGVHIELFNDKISDIYHFDPLNGNKIDRSILNEKRRGSHMRSITQDEQDFLEHRMVEGDFTIIFPSKHYITAKEKREQAQIDIAKDLELRIADLKSKGKDLEAYRLEQKTNYDLEMIKEIGYCKGIENYSRYFDGRAPGSSPYTLLDFFPKDFLCVIDESHITVPQIRGMYNGDRARKETLIEYGFRLPSALDNRPLKFEEFLRRTPLKLFASATPNEWELSLSSNNVAEQLIRPTGVVDPSVTILPTKGQIDDLLKRILERVERKERILVTTLTKRMAEELASFLVEKNIKVTYLHSDIKTLERTDILDKLRKGEYDVLVGINLLREGLDLPEVSLVAILDADKEGFLRSKTSLVQTMGRAARHISGEVVMYADNVTDSMKYAISEVERRRKIQEKYNKKHNITPLTIIKPFREQIYEKVEEEVSGKERKKLTADIDYTYLPPNELKKVIKGLEEQMKYEAEMLNFEKAAVFRDEVRRIRSLGIKRG